jgi:hypothetical protein
MKKSNLIIRLAIFFIITIAIVFWNYKTRTDLSSKQEGLSVTKWDNFYGGNNIHFYYLTPQNENLTKLKNKYGLTKLINSKADQLDNSIKIMEFINENVKASNESMTSDKNAFEIMEAAFNGSKISDNDYVAMYEECLASLGINVRTGILRSTDKQSKVKSYYNVCEVWSDKYNKWIMIDGVNGCYMKENGVPLSTVEIITKGIAKVQIAIIKDANKYIKNMSKYYESYSISVDNNKYGAPKSNSEITFLKEKQLPEIETKEGFIKPTIFVNNSFVFDISPKVEYIDTATDKIPTLIFAKKDLKNDEKGVDNFTVGAFMNSYMVPKYFLKINGSDYIEVQTFFDLKIKKGVNNIKLSLDGKTLAREVIIEK